MPIKLSEHLGVSSSLLERRGVFDALIGLDSRLFVDPMLLRRLRIPEFRGSRAKFERHFSHILRLLGASRAPEDAAWREARRRLIFRETQGVSLGYGVQSANGNAIGPVLGDHLLHTASEIVKLGITDPVIFELLGLFEEGFGPDRLSDMTISIIRDDLFNYSQRVCRQLHISKLTSVRNRDRDYRIAAGPDGRSPLVFVPKKLLLPLPVAFSWGDIDSVVAHNQWLRQRINELIGRIWRRGTRVAKSDLKAALLNTPASLISLINAYKANDSVSYDFERDPLGLLQWYELGRKFAARHPIQLSLGKSANINELEAVVEAIIEQFRKNIEQNGLDEHLYSDDGKPRHERFCQRLFYGIADSYCRANNLDLSREPNAGSGPVDFKVSAGYEGRMLVEIKLSSNTQLLHGFRKQLPAYQDAEGTERSAYVVIRVTRSDRTIRRVVALRERAILAGQRAPKIFVIDGRTRPSASRR
jgi:hypothetical protein